MVTTGCDQASSPGCEPLETLGSGPVKTREALEVCYKQLGGGPQILRSMNMKSGGTEAETGPTSN